MHSVGNTTTGSLPAFSTDVVCIGSRQGQDPALAMPTPLLVPTPPTVQDEAYDRTLNLLLKSFQSNEARPITPAPIAVSIDTNFSVSMAVFSDPAPPYLDTHKTLVPVPLRLIPMLSKKITDRHLRETYRYYKWFVDKEKRAAISELPEGASKKNIGSKV